MATPHPNNDDPDYRGWGWSSGLGFRVSGGYHSPVIQQGPRILKTPGSQLHTCGIVPPRTIGRNPAAAGSRVASAKGFGVLPGNIISMLGCIKGTCNTPLYVVLAWPLKPLEPFQNKSPPPIKAFHFPLA